MGGFSRRRSYAPRARLAVRGVRTPNPVNVRTGGRGGSSFYKNLAGEAAMAALGSINPSAAAAAGIASSIYGAVRSFQSNKSGRRKSVTYDTANYAGKFSKKKLKEPLMTKIARNGYTGVIEQGGQLSDAHCVWIGHASIAMWQYALSGAAAILRKAFQSIDLDIERAESALPVSGTWTVQIQYVNPTDMTTENYALNFTSADSLDSISGPVAIEMVRRANIAPIAAGFRWKAQELRLLDGNGAIMLKRDLTRSKITFFAISSLKVQNSSHVVTALDEDDNSADDVNNVPLIGKGYTGPGSGMYAKFLPAASQQTEGQFNLHGDGDTGLIAAAAGAAREIQEPPLAAHFAKCKTATKGVLLQPGTIKSSTLSTKVTKPVNAYFSALKPVVTAWTEAQIQGNGTQGTKCYLGKYHTFALEKQLNSSTDNINIRAEVNYKFGAMAQLTKARPVAHRVHLRTLKANLAA